MGVADLGVRNGHAWGYRHRVRLAVRGRAANPKFGLFEAGTHRVVDIPDCLVHHPRINEVAKWLKHQVRAARIPPYNETHHAGLLRYVQLALEPHSLRVQIVLVANSAEETPLLGLSALLQKEAPATVHSLVFNGHTARSNAVLGPTWKLLWGEPYLVDHSAGVQVFYPPGAFSQSNPRLFQRLTEEAHTWIEDGAEVVELYCGVGAIGLGLFPRVNSLVFNEISARGLDGLERGLRELRHHGGERDVRVTVCAGEALSGLPYIGRETTVVVDPPRKGLEAPVLSGLCERQPRRIIYVSCGFEAFKRDAKALVDSGYNLARARAFALFPFTEHVETLADFTRA
jgi:23S rRNA (uracil-5-)-methyltransferase RumA